MKFNLLFVSFILFVFSLEIQAQEVCIQNSEEDTVAFGLMKKIDTSDVDSVFSTYIKYARDNNYIKIKKIMSREDGSVDYFQNSEIDMAEKYKNYKDIKSVSREAVFNWGDYVVMLHNYLYGGGAISLGTMFNCKEECYLSNLFERPDENIDMLSWVLRDYSAEQKIIDCPNKKLKILSIVPHGSSDYKNSLSVYLSHDFDINRPLKIENTFSDKQLSCVNEMKVLGKNFTDKAADVSGFLQRCTMNFDTESMYPVVVSEESITNKKYIDIEVVFRLLSSAKQINYIGSVSYKSWDIPLLVLEVGEEKRYLLSIPFFRNQGLDSIDWGFFGTSVGYLLSTVSFSDYVYREKNND